MSGNAEHMQSETVGKYEEAVHADGEQVDEVVGHQLGEDELAAEDQGGSS